MKSHTPAEGAQTMPTLRTTRPHRWRGAGLLTAALLAGLAVGGSALAGLAGCTRSDTAPAPGFVADEGKGGAPIPSGAAADRGGEGTGGQPGEPKPAPAPVTERSLIY